MNGKVIAKTALIVALCAALNACGSIYERETIGIGTDLTELKRSPCACLQLDLPRDLPAWLTVQG